jgi:hypothetical protein
VLFAVLHMSGIGPKLPRRSVTFAAAFRGKADTAAVNRRGSF